jgi:hypothetical protein
VNHKRLDVIRDLSKSSLLECNCKCAKNTSGPRVRLWGNVGEMCGKYVYTERRCFNSTTRTFDVVWCAVMNTIVARADVRNTVVGKHFLNEE